MKKKELSKEEQEFQDACKLIVKKTKEDIVAVTEFYSIHEMEHLYNLFELLSKAEYRLHEDEE